MREPSGAAPFWRASPLHGEPAAGSQQQRSLSPGHARIQNNGAAQSHVGGSPQCLLEHTSEAGWAQVGGLLLAGYLSC